MKFADKLKRQRAAAGLTQQQLAAKAGVSQSAIAAYELGTREPGLDALAKLCDALGVPCTAFVPTAPRKGKPR